ncbi:MAG: hypothetical protein NTX64_13780 [Elusimicrobia bacterium]|nr:hypothetical protein [Elusimicrobiota bacterium]
MKRAHVWLIATCVAIPIFLAAENTPTKAPAAPPVAKPPEQESLKPADVKELPAPVYHCDGCGTKGYPGPRCEQKVLDAEKTIGYPTTPVGGHGCTHWVWKVLSTSGDWNHARYVDAKGWETLALDKKKAKLQEIGAYLDEVDEAYGKVWKQANLIIGVYQKGASLSGAVASQPNAKVYAPRQVQCKAFSEGGLWVPESTSPGPRFATYQERINYLQTKLTPLELKGGQSADDLKKDFDATAKALDLRDIVLGKQLREMGDYVDKARGAVQKLCAAPASEGSKLADQKLNVKDIESMRKTVDQVGKEAMEAALFNSEAGSKLSPEEKAGVKASMQELVVIYDPKDHKPMFVQHLVAKGKDGKEVESYKTFHVDEGGADTVTKLVQQLASQIQKDDSLWGSMKATVGVIAADPVAAAKDTAKNLKDWFPPASGDSKAALERRYAAAESDAGSQALAKLNKTRAGLKTWDQKAEQACNEQWRKYDIEDAMIDKLKTAEDTKPRDPKAPAPDTAYQRAKNVLEAARKQYSAAGPDGKPVLCKDKGNSGLGEAMDARWSDAVVAENAKLGGVRAESAASSEGGLGAGEGEAPPRVSQADAHLEGRLFQ